MKISEVLSLLKVSHYVKNLVVIIPLVFSLNIFNTQLLKLSVLAMISFCLVSSAVYIMNDILDIDKDRLHPVKSKRAIASGKISKNSARIIMGVLFAASLYIVRFNTLCLFCVAGYFILNIVYSFKLKEYFLIDAACIAIGFILRILSGCFAISVVPSPLVILMTFFVSMFFTFTKRRLELKLISGTHQEREALNGISEPEIAKFIIINAVLSVSFYITYMLDDVTIVRAGTEYLYCTVIPFTLIIYRLLLLADKKLDDDDPMHLFKKDKTLFVLILFYLITLIAVLAF